METITSKEQGNRLFQAGCYGAKLRTWETWGDLMRSDYAGLCSVRYKEPGSPFCRYNVPKDDVIEVVTRFCDEGAKLRMFVFGEMAPDDRLTIQGEYAWLSGDWYLYYSTQKVPMRVALKEGKHLRGYAAQFVMREYLTPSSYEDLQAIFDTFKDPVVEFSSFSQTVGAIPGRNTIVWEVRSTF